ncbi:MAG: ComEC/Rec2 family competence protein [Clostridia bacterium]|nr:ComEC/Rec2 family competence protein [Clostridia bacterium]
MACLVFGAVLLTVGAALLILIHTRPVRALSACRLWSVAAAAAGLVLCVTFAWQRCSVLPALRLDGERAVVGGTVISLPQKSGNMYRYTLDTHLITVEGAPQRMKLNVYSLQAPKPGDSIYLTATLRAPQTAREHASLQADETVLNAFSFSDITTEDAIRRPMTSRLVRLRQRLGEGFSLYLTPDGAAVARALLLGDKSLLSNELYGDYRASGLAHVLATSGMHTSILILAAYGFLRLLRLRIRPACTVTALLVMGYMALVGFLPSVTRAGLMALLMLTARMLSTRADTLNSLGASAWLMVTLFPPCIGDISFLLSFASTLGILLCAPHAATLTQHLCKGLPRVLRKPCGKLLTALGVGVAANLFTLPLSMTYFETVSTVSVFSTLPACILLTVVLPLLAVFSALWAFGAGGVLLRPIASLSGMLLKALSSIARAFGTLPFAELPTGYRLVCTAVTVCIILFTAMLLYRPLRRFTVMLCSAGALTVCGAFLFTALYHANAATLAVFPHPNGSCVLLKYGNEVALAGDASRYQTHRAAGMLRSLGEHEIDHLLFSTDEARSDWQANGISVQKVYLDRVGQRLDTVHIALGDFAAAEFVYRGEDSYILLKTALQTLLMTAGTAAQDADLCVLLDENARFEGSCGPLYCVSPQNARDCDGFLMTEDQPIVFRITKDGIVRTNAVF